MDIFQSGIPNIRIKNYGTKRKPLEIIEATIVLEAEKLQAQTSKALAENLVTYCFNRNICFINDLNI
jgi:hypothetical protein